MRGVIRALGLDHIFIQPGRAPPRSSQPTIRSLSGLLVHTYVWTNVTIPSQTYKIIQVDNITSIIPKVDDGVFLYMSKELNDLSDRGFNDLSWLSVVTLVPNEEEFPRRCGQDDHALKEAWAWRGKAAEWRCDLAQAATHHVPYVLLFLLVGWLGTPHEKWGMYSPPEL